MVALALYLTGVDKFYLYPADFTTILNVHTELFNVRDVSLIVYLSSVYTFSAVSVNLRRAEAVR